MTRRKVGRIEATTRRVLTGRLGEPLAQVAVALAQTLDERHSVSTIASTSREFRQVLDRLGVLEQVEQSPGSARDDDGERPAASVSRVDELARMRREREAAGQ